MYPRIVLSWNFRPIGIGDMFESPNAGRGVWWDVYEIFRDPHNQNVFHITIRQSGWSVGSDIHVITKAVDPWDRVLWLEPWDIPPVVNHPMLRDWQWGVVGYWHEK